MKRKADDRVAPTANGHSKKRATANGVVKEHFRRGLFDPESMRTYTENYATSQPYKHAVVPELLDDELLRSVRAEIVGDIHFTPKETDIYKIHQSGDLANLDGLPETALEKLPSLLKLRDALYSQDFRQWISSVSGSGPLSGKKTDMAVNVYVPGCHLLCHDDVIGSRRVSYILYLTDPDDPWKEEWGGALRLFPVDNVRGREGKTFKLPQADWSLSIPPAWNQLSFFAVQPGESFHDVGEVLHGENSNGVGDGGRVRMAISGWFHIPQECEDGFEPGLEEKLAQRSSLKQLQGNADELDQPQPDWQTPAISNNVSSSDDDEVELNEEDLHFLIKYLNPNYLTPDTVEELNELFTEESIVQVAGFLNTKFSEALKNTLETDIGVSQDFQTSRPPHKHHYQYIQSRPAAPPQQNLFRQILDELFPSLAFKKWLSLVTGLTLLRSSIFARRFRKGHDYQLAQSYEGENPQLEYTLCVTPSTGWGAEDEDNTKEGEHNGKGKASEDENDNCGGYELYMAGEELDDGSDDGVTVPANPQSHTGAGDRRSAKKKKSDPAVYQAAADDDEDDGILFSNAATWNTLSIVLRDKGTLKFVKYVSDAAPGDRYDITGCVEVEEDEDEDDDDDDDDDEDVVRSGPSRA